MLLLDERIGSRELLPYIKRITKVPVELTHLSYGDACWEGNLDKGRALIGVERKTLHDMLNCIDDSRYAAHQLPGMRKMYAKSILILEGCWKPHDPDGYLMESFNGGGNWGYCKYRSRPVLYSKLHNYLLSASLSGVTVTYSRDMFQTAYNICEMYQYFDKKWSDHKSMLETQKLNIPQAIGKPSLVRKWAAEIDGVGVEYSQQAEQLFKTPIKLATSQEMDWMRMDRMSAKRAVRIIKDINGVK